MRKKMASNSNWFSRARRQQEYDRRVATHLHLLTPHLLFAVTPSIVSHIRRSIIRDHGRGYEDLWNRYFKPDCRVGLHSLQKMTAALRMLAYGAPADSMDDSFQLAETTAVESMKIFCKTIVRLYRSQYLRKPIDNDLARLFEKGEVRGFPGMLGSLDCMHWIWKNCPTAWHGQYCGHHGAPTLILKTVAS